MQEPEVINLITEQLKPIYKEIDTKVSSDTFWTVQKILIGIILAYAGSIIGLYVLYYSGIAELKTSVAVIETKVGNIEKTLNSAQITSQ